MSKATSAPQCLAIWQSESGGLGALRLKANHVFRKATVTSHSSLSLFNFDFNPNRNLFPSANTISKILILQPLAYLGPVHEAKKTAADSALTHNDISLSLDPNHNPGISVNKICLFFVTWLTVQCLEPNHEANFWRYKAWCEQDRFPVLVPSPRTPMATELGSMALPPTQARRSSCRGHSLNGRDVQLDKLGNPLTAPTRQATKRFAPSDDLSLPNNLLTPVPKKRRRNKKVSRISYFAHLC